MKVAFDIYARRPLGRMLQQLLDALAGCEATTPKDVSLFSRSGRTDIPISEVIDAAAASAGDTCLVRTVSGEVEIRWRYGPRAHVQSIAGVLTVTSKQCSDLRRVLVELCVAAGAVYAFCDLQTAVDADTRLIGGMLYREQAFVGIYWFNYFGPEYRLGLDVDEAFRADATEVEDTPKGGLIVVLGATPEGRDESNAQAIAGRWPVFQKYRPQATFKNPIVIDYAEVRSLSGTASGVTTIASTVGLADEFIANVSVHAERFHEWARTEGLSPKSPADFQTVFQEYEPIIRDQLLVPAIAAYGESVRAVIGGVWRKAALLHRGEPIVVRRGQPWTARRIIFEVLEELSNHADE